MFTVLCVVMHVFTVIASLSEMISPGRWWIKYL